MDKEFYLIYGAKITSNKHGFVATFRDFKTIFAEGDTHLEAINSAHEALDLILIEMSNDGREVPDPTALRKGEYPITVSPKIAVPILLRKIRKQQDFSMVEVAQSMGVSYQNYQQIENGKNMTLNSLKQASNALGAVPVVKFYVQEPVHNYLIKQKIRKKPK